jgi:hypothetical protein
LDQVDLDAIGAPIVQFGVPSVHRLGERHDARI